MTISNKAQTKHRLPPIQPETRSFGRSRDIQSYVQCYSCCLGVISACPPHHFLSGASSVLCRPCAGFDAGNRGLALLSESKSRLGNANPIAYYIQFIIREVQNRTVVSSEIHVVLSRVRSHDKWAYANSIEPVSSRAIIQPEGNDADTK